MSNTSYKLVLAARILICLMAAFVATSASAATTIEQADSAYNARNFRQALGLYNKVLDQQGSSSQLYYNIGNANYRLGNTGDAVIAYERALRLDPSNANARANLDFVTSSIKGLPEDGETFLSNIHSGIMSWTTPDGWAWTAFVLFLLVLGCVATYLFSSNVILRKVGFFGAIVLMFIFIYALVIAYQAGHAIDNHDTAVVITQNAKLRTNPGAAKSRDDKSINIPEGSHVTIIDSVATPSDPASPMYYNVKLNSSTQAWIGSADVERI